MGTVIYRNIPDGGMGLNDRQELIGYCIEEPFEVLKKILMSHVVHKYKGLYMPIDRRCPNNMAGLIISEYSDSHHKGLKTTITGKFSHLDLTKDLSPHSRDKQQILSDLEKCRKWHTYSTNKKLEKQYWKTIDEIKSYVEQL